MRKTKAIILSAPSGSGKTTLRKYLTDSRSDFALSVSCTTRERRQGENHGVDYYFIPIGEFKERISKNEFIECEEVYDDIFYGTSKREIDGLNRNGKIVVFDVDVVGALNLKNYFGEEALSIFIDCDPLERENRLRSRGTEKEKDIEIRLAKAEEEYSKKDSFDAVVLNDDLETSKLELINLIESHL